MRFALHPYVHEIISCIATHLVNDESAEARRGCIFVLSRLFKEMGSDVLELVAERLKEIYHLLKYTAERDHDQMVRFHAKAVLEQLNDIALALLQGGSPPPMDDQHVLKIIK